MKKVTLLQLFVAAIAFSFTFAQDAVRVGNYFNDASFSPASNKGTQYIHAHKSRTFNVDLDILKEKLVLASHRNSPNFGTKVFIEIPNPDGGQDRYQVLANTTMAEGLQRAFPGIRTFDVIKADDKGVHGKIDFTYQGFHAMIKVPGKGSFFIDPVFMGNTEYHMAYWRSDFHTDKMMSCEFEGNSDISNEAPEEFASRAFGTCELRTYRLALCATGEYTQFHGGTVADAASAQVTTMNRVNEVYERDMAITMTIVGNNNLLIYTNGGTDPFTNGNPGAMINESQTECNNVIGSANYDIGHVFGTNSGGLAGLGVVCFNNSKGRGVTGSGAPVGDPFDIDYVAHEMGHQFGCNHTFNNSCGGNRNNGTAVEPGSGSSIMAYAGICPSNVQNNSDDHFHGISLEEMGDHITSTSCAVTNGLSNNPPVITATPNNIYVPANTPFALTCTANDPDGNTLLYCWEQMDNDISTQPPVATSTTGPNYRSNSPTTSPTRYFPQLSDVLAGNLTPTWEVTPSVSRAFSFRVTVRDQAPGGGCNDHADITMNTDASAGPFLVTYPNATGITWGGLTNQTITWDVANTDNANVNCQLVDIFLSVDGGNTYPTQIADNVPNNGSYGITVPNTPSTACRVMIMAENGTFFDISDNNFTITVATDDYTLDCSSPTQSVCQGSNATYTIDVGNVGTYNDPVTLTANGLPGGAVASFGTNPVSPVGTSTLTISGTAGITPGNYPFTVEGSSTSGTKFINLTLAISSSSVSSVTLNFPADASTGVATPVNFQWSDAGPGSMYDLEVATDAGFGSIVSNQTGLTTNSYLESGLSTTTMYYWRVTAYNSCSTAPVSSTFSFETGGCANYVSNDPSQTIPASGSTNHVITSTITISGTSGTINDIDVVDLVGTHDWINDLVVTLESPAGTSITLWDQICNDEDDFDLSLDDQATPGALPCPPVGGGSYQPEEALSAFNGESANGTWTLTVTDVYPSLDGGSLDGWGLNVCLANCTLPSTPTVSASQPAVCPGTSTTLSIASGSLNDATDWEWFAGSCGGTPAGTGSSINVSPNSTTTYYVRGEGGCVGTSASCGDIAITVNPEYNLSESASICNGDTYTFPDGTTSTTSTTHVSNLSTFAGCDSVITTTLTVVSLSDQTTTAGFTITSSQASSATYQWVDCDNGNAAINGETGQSYTATANGNYAVVVTSSVNSSCSVTSACVEISGVGLDENGEIELTIFPNPSAGNYKVQFVGMNNYSDLEIMDDRGRVVYRKQMNGELDFDIDLTNQATGIYIMKLRNTDEVKIVKLIKQ